MRSRNEADLFLVTFSIPCAQLDYIAIRGTCLQSLATTLWYKRTQRTRFARSLLLHEELEPPVLEAREGSISTEAA